MGDKKRRATVEEIPGMVVKSNPDMAGNNLSMGEVSNSPVIVLRSPLAMATSSPGTVDRLSMAETSRLSMRMGGPRIMARRVSVVTIFVVVADGSLTTKKTSTNMVSVGGGEVAKDMAEDIRPSMNTMNTRF